MPIYEFYCSECHAIYNFFSKRINTEKIPGCPECGRRKLERRLSVFAVSKGRKEQDEDVFGDFDETRMEKAVEAMAGEMDRINEDDPRQVARMMRKLYDTMGVSVGAGMEETIRRMEAGEDPDKIEEEMGDLLNDEDPFTTSRKRTGLDKLRRRLLPPRIDKTLYDL